MSYLMKATIFQLKYCRFFKIVHIKNIDKYSQNNVYIQFLYNKIIKNQIILIYNFQSSDVSLKKSDKKDDN